MYYFESNICLVKHVMVGFCIAMTEYNISSVALQMTPDTPFRVKRHILKKIAQLKIVVVFKWLVHFHHKKWSKCLPKKWNDHLKSILEHSLSYDLFYRELCKGQFFLNKHLLNISSADQIRLFEIKLTGLSHNHHHTIYY